MSKMQKRCVIYTRCASAYINGEALLAQEDECLAYIKKHDNNSWIFVEKTYRDNGVSGMTLNRSGLTRLMDDAKRQKFDCVVMTCPSRLSRKLDDSDYLFHTFQSYGVEVHYAQQEIANHLIGVNALKEIGRA
jgi:DNA invertase Pin-like site-specific DNA recombinase